MVCCARAQMRETLIKRFMRLMMAKDVKKLPVKAVDMDPIFKEMQVRLLILCT